MRTTHSWPSLLAVCGACVASLVVRAGDQDPSTDSVPRVIPYRGMLDLDGSPATATLDLLFVIYDQAAGDNWDGDGAAPAGVLWSTEKTVQVTAGRFSVLLGEPADPPVGAVVGYADELYLGITVVQRDSGGAVTARIPLQGRQAIVPVPFALWSASSANLDVSGDLDVAGNLSTGGELTASSITANAGISAQSVTVSAGITADTVAATTVTATTVTADNLGSLYVRWGRTVCAGDAELVYAGYMAGSHYTQAGNGGNPLCLVKDPIFSDHDDNENGGANVYGAEFETGGTGLASFVGHQNYDVQCAVCYAPRRPTSLMIPGRNQCPAGWTREFPGYLMGGRSDYGNQTSYLCIDAAAEKAGSPTNSDGLLLYPVESECGSLPCGSSGYAAHRELTCAVCTR